MLVGLVELSSTFIDNRISRAVWQEIVATGMADSRTRSALTSHVPSAPAHTQGLGVTGHKSPGQPWIRPAPPAVSLQFSLYGLNAQPTP